MSNDAGCNVSIVEISAGTTKIVEVSDGTNKIVEVQTQGPQGPNFNPSLSPAYTTPVNSDLLPIFDVASGLPKKITVEDLIAKRARDSRRIYLSKNDKANDSNNGTSQEEPLLTFAAAIAAAEPGDVIEVSPGVYIEESLPLRVPRDVGIFAKSLRQVKIQPAAGQEMNGFFKVDSGFWVWGLEFAGHQADLANNQQSWAISFDEQADNTAAPLNASGLGAFILKSPYIQNCSSITAEDDAGTAGSVSVGDTGGGIEVDGDKCASNSPIRSMVVDSYTQVNLGGPGCYVFNDGYAQLVSFFGTFCTFHVKTETGGQANLSGGGTTDFGDQGLVADGYSRLPNFTGSARIAAYGADRAEGAISIDVNTDVFTAGSPHPLVVNDQVTFNATDGTLPGGLSEGTTYFVIASGLTANDFKVSATQGGASVNITGSASGTYQFVRQGELTADVISFTANRIGTKSRPNPGQLMFPRQTFPSAGQPGSIGNPVGVTAGAGSSFTLILNTFSYAHEYVSGGTVTIGGTSYNIASASYDNATGIITLTATGYTPNTGDSAVLAGLDFICPIQGAYTITGSVPIDASGNVVAVDSPSLAGYRLNFYNTVNGGLRSPLAINQVLDFRLRSQISCALHTMEFVGSGTNYNALPWNGGVPIAANQRVELNNGRVFGATINEKGDFEIGDGTFSIDGTTGEATINTSQFNISGLNFIGPFSRNGGFSTVGVQLKEVSANTSLIASTGAADGNTVPTQSAVKAFVENNTVNSVDLSAPTGFTSSGGPVTSAGTLALNYDTGYQGFLTSQSTKLAGIEDNATRDQTASEIKIAYESNADTNVFDNAAETKLAGIEDNATRDQTAVEIKTAYESNANTNAFTDSEQTKLAGIEDGAQVNVGTNLSYTSATQELASSTGTGATLPTVVAGGDAGLITGADKTKLDGIEAGATGDQTASEIKTAYESNADTNVFNNAAETKLAGIEAGATGDQTASEIKTAYESNADTNVFDNAAETKLAGIEAGATGDQTDAEIKIAYENNADTNVFNDAAETKLAGIEANATQDQTDSEIKVAYENNADTNAFTDAEQTKLAGIESNATADQSAGEIKASYESNADTNAFTDSEKTKLSGIAAGAQVNVATDLGYTSGTRVISSSTGNDATLPLAVAGGDAGLLTGADKTQLDNLTSNLAGKANLIGGKLDPSELPDLAVTEFKGTVANQAAMLAVTGEKGDWVVRSDDGKVYVITGDNPSLIGSWTALSYPASDVLSVNGLTGSVVLDADDVSDAATTNKYTTTADISKLSGIEAGAQVNVATDLSYTASTRVIASSTGTDATLPVMSSGNPGLVPASGGGTTNFLRADGTFAVPPGGGGGGAVDSVNGQTGTVVLDADDISDATTTNKFTTAGEITKLSGIEVGATADQSGAEIKVAYESEANTNAYTDAEKAKLLGIEANATADQTDAEIKTAYENNADTNAFDDAAVTKLGSIETNATADQTAGEIKTAYESNADTNAFDDAAVTKLAGIEANATADQTAGEIKTAYESNADTNVFDDAAVTKLSGIETGATADQTAGEIKTEYESNNDTNAFTDAEQTKLAGIAAGAQVNVATNLSYTASTRTIASSTGTDAVITEVVAGGNSGLMTGVDKTKLNGIETGATADQTDAQIKTAYENNANTNAFTDAEQSKLAGIEAGATADQTAGEIKTAYESNANTNAYTDAEVSKLAGIASGAEVNVNADWNSVSGDSLILNKPTIPAAYTNTDVDNHLNTGTAAANEILSWSGTDYDWISQGGSNPVALKLPIAASAALPTAETEQVVNNIFNTSAVFNSSNGTAWSFVASSITIPEDGYYCCSVDVTVTSAGARATQLFMFGVNGTSQQGRSSHAYVRNSNSINQAGCVLTELISLSAGDVLTLRSRAEGTTTDARSSDATTPGSISIHKITNSEGVPGPAGPSDIPQNSRTGAYQLALSDNGKHINITTGGVTVPSGVFSAGNVVSIYNDSASTQTITQGGGVTLREGGTANTGNVLLSQRGLCTILCVASNEFVITGHIA